MKNKIYEFIQDFIKTNKYAPTIREICQGVGLQSSNSVHGYLHRLRDEKMIDFKDSSPRTIVVLNTSQCKC